MLICSQERLHITKTILNVSQRRQITLLDYPNILQTHIINYFSMDQDLAGMCDPQAMGCMHLKIAMSVAQHPVVNVLQAHCETSFVTLF